MVFGYGIIASVSYLTVDVARRAAWRKQAASCIGRKAAVRPQRWGAGIAARSFRRLVNPSLLTLVRALAWIRTENVDAIAQLEGPFILAANHPSDIDTAVLMAALPSPWRYRLAPTVAEACFVDVNRVWKRFKHSMLLLFANGLTLPRGSSLRSALRHMGWLVNQGWAILVYPEGQISESSQSLPFEAGIGMIATRLHIPVVPVRIEGTDRIYHRSSLIPRPGRTFIRFGQPLSFEGNDYRAAALQIEEAVRALAGPIANPKITSSLHSRQLVRYPSN